MNIGTMNKTNYASSIGFTEKFAAIHLDNLLLSERAEPGLIRIREPIYNFELASVAYSIGRRLYVRPQIRISAMSLSELANRCMKETCNYRHGVAYNDQFGLEILRRAILQCDQHAWEWWQHCFSDLVRGWLARHPRREAAYGFDSAENYIAQAFERLWLAATYNENLAFSTLAGALRYLHACLNAAILDTLRAYSRPKEVPLPEPDAPGEPFAEDNEDGSEVWETIRSMLPNPREQRLTYLLFHCGLKPREIVRVCPDEFSDAREIYHMQRNILSRLRRNADQIHWRLGEE